jgi:murein DD-endopeptidase MepM/ murein hydrolase activator NlpD
MAFPALLTAFLAVASTLAPVPTSTPSGQWPLQPRPAVVAGFDPPETRFGTGHRGVDLAGRPGQWVRAAMPGRINFSGVIAGRGVVVVNHGATRTTYEPVAGLLPGGTPVTAGEVIGRLQLVGSHCRPAACLHWGWLRGSTYLDPLLLVGAAGPVRLWPWERRPDPVSPPARPWADWSSVGERWAQARGCAC